MSMNKLPARTAIMAGIAAATALAGIANVPLAAYAADSLVSGLAAVEAAPVQYIVLFEEAPLATYRGEIPGLAAAPKVASASSTRATKLDTKSSAARAYVSYLESRQQAFLSTASSLLRRPLQPQFTYKHAVNGMAVDLTAAEAAQIAKLPGVVSVRREPMLHLATDAGPRWIGAPAVWSGAATGAGTRGEGVVVGVIDTGINFDSPSFAATDADGYTHTNPNGAGVYLGTCATGGFDAGKCNSKLIGAYNFVTSIPSGAPDVPGSAADAGDHGSHTASTSAGNRATVQTEEGATVTVSGVAPQANIIAYKVCFTPPPNFTGGGTCSPGATTAAADQALADGVDVINYSISGGSSPWNDSTSIAFRNAAAAGIFVAVSGGNTAAGDPNPAQPGTVNHHEPWTISVAASSHDRAYNPVQLSVPGFRDIAGAKSTVPAPEVAPAFTTPITGPLAVGTDRRACTSFEPAPAPGFIAVIERGDCNFSVKINNAQAAGAAAVVVYNNVGGPPAGMSVAGTSIPALAISRSDGQALLLRLGVFPNTSGTASELTVPVFSVNQDYGDIMATFSLLGPAGGTTNPRDLLKPDITAPGLSILAAGHSGNEYVFMQGTSMSSPHVAGAGALLRALHPDWTPMEIKSALMLSAVAGSRKHTVTTLADPFDAGAGRAHVESAASSPLVMDETVDRMIAANPATGGDLSALNMPSLSKASCASTCTFTRTVRNPTSSAQTFTAEVASTNDTALSGTVTPANFTLAAGATQTLTITIDNASAAVGAWSFGKVSLFPASGGTLAMPVAVRRSAGAPTAPQIEVAPGSLATSQAAGAVTTRTLGISNTGTATLNWTVGEEPAAAPEVVLSVGEVAEPAAPNGGVLLQIDNGLGTNVVGVGPGRQIIFLNRFTPDAADLPFTLTHVDLQFLGSLANGDQGAVIGELFDLFIYRDNDANPANGATLLISVLGVPVSALDDQLQSVTIPNGVEIDGAGDVLVAIVNRGAVGAAPATGDAGPSVGRSFIAAPTATISNAPNLATLGLVRVEQALATFNRNFVLRARGTQGSGGVCSALADVPWLSASPLSGSTAPSASSNVTVSFDSTGLAAGTYSANLCVSSNDADDAIVAVPVEMTVTDAPKDDVIFADGFESGGSASCEPLQLLQDPSLEQTAGPFGSNPFWQSVDDNDPDSSVLCNGGCSTSGVTIARTGEFFAWFGGWDASAPNYTANVKQSVVIPAGSPRFLNFWKLVGRAGPQDSMTVTVNGTNVYTESPTQADSDYVHKSIDLSAFADGSNKEIEFKFSHQMGAIDANYFLDDITLDCTAEPASGEAVQSVRPSGLGDLSKRR